MDLIVFVVALSILVLVHELGHYLAAKLVGVRVEEFGLGLPPRIIGKKIKGTIWSLNLLPIGGFCKLFGEDPSSTGVLGKLRALRNKRRSFYYKKPWQKGLIVLGGVLMNLVLAVSIFCVVYARVGIPVESDRVKVLEVAKDSPAQRAGLKEGDWVKEVEGKKVTTASDLTAEVVKYKEKKVVLWVNDKVILVEVREKPPEGEGGMGVVVSNTEMQKIPWYQFYRGIGAGFKEAFFWGKIIFGGLVKMIGGLLMGQVPKDVSGPIGMYQATSSIKKSQGLLAVAHFFGVVSVNLAIVNVLPFPALDGGRIIFVLYEFLFRKRANQKLELWVNNLGMMILLSLILLITVGDVVRIFRK